MIINEGGNIFKDASGRALTQRINQTDVKSTIAWLEQLTGLELQDNALGSTGRKPTSGDLDLAVDANQVSKDQLHAKLSQWAQSHGFKPDEYVRKSGISVHLKTPINGRPDNGYVQTDFMFLKDVPFSKFILSAPGDSKYRGVDRNILINSMAKSMGYKLSQVAGLMTRTEPPKLITNAPDQLAKILLNKKATADDLHSVETIIAALANDPEKDAKLKDAREHFAREGVPFFETAELKPVTGYSEVNFLSRLRDRIVNQGMQPLVETTLMEADARIEHLEDLVFERGTRGVKAALDIITHAAEDTAGTTTVK
jgi:hypothetical protein